MARPQGVIERNALIERMIELAGEGLSASRIGDALGVTRNTVIGALSRRGHHCCSGGQRRAAGSYAPRPRPVIVKTPPPEPVRVDPARDDLGNLYTLRTLRGGCRWPNGDPLDADFHLCGNARSAGSSYCAFHQRTAHQTSRRRVA